MVEGAVVELLETAQRICGNVQVLLSRAVDQVPEESLSEVQRFALRAMLREYGATRPRHISAVIEDLPAATYADFGLPETTPLSAEQRGLLMETLVSTAAQIVQEEIGKLQDVVQALSGTS